MSSTTVFFFNDRVVAMETLMSAVTPRSPAPIKKLSEVDFRSGATLDQLSSQVSELVVLEQGDFGDQTALEVHTAKDFIFNMLGRVLFALFMFYSGYIGGTMLLNH